MLDPEVTRDNDKKMTKVGCPRKEGKRIDSRKTITPGGLVIDELHNKDGRRGKCQ